MPMITNLLRIVLSRGEFQERPMFEIQINLPIPKYQSEFSTISDRGAISDIPGKPRNTPSYQSGTFGNGPRKPKNA